MAWQGRHNEAPPPCVLRGGGVYFHSYFPAPLRFAGLFFSYFTVLTRALAFCMARFYSFVTDWLAVNIPNLFKLVAVGFNIIHRILGLTVQSPLPSPLSGSDIFCIHLRRGWYPQIVASLWISLPRPLLMRLKWDRLYAGSVISLFATLLVTVIRWDSNTYTPFGLVLYPSGFLRKLVWWITSYSSDHYWVVSWHT